MSGEALVKVENISKKFCRSLKRSLWYGLQDIGMELMGRKCDRELRPDEFWAVKDVSVELRRGECLGLIGPNGAGKSTLLKILNGLIKPDKGRIEICGRVGALIELGMGFNPILTGLENIYNNAAVLGISKAEIDRKLDAIVEFAEIGDFLNTPVQNYSSGMKVRLGFAVAAQMEPDVLIIDEVLAVGDVGFRAKCFNAIHNLMQRAAVIFVSHSMPQVSRICSDIMMMNHGKCEFQGKDVGKGIELFYTHFEVEKSIVIGGQKAKIIEVELESNGVMGIAQINYLDDLIVHIRAQVNSDIKYPNIIVNIYGQELQIITQCSSYFNGFKIYNSGQEFSVSLKLEKINLNPSVYLLEVGITAEKNGEMLVKHQAIKSIKVIGKHIGYAPVLPEVKWSLNDN